MSLKLLFLRRYIIPNLMAVGGAIIAAFALSEFLVPSTILDGGVTGISIILNQLTGFSLGLLIIVLNIPFFIVGFLKFGHAFFIRASICVCVFSFATEYFENCVPFDATEDPLLATIYGGLLLGIGVGTVLKHDGCLDGTEIVALLLSQRTPFSVGQIVFGFNIFIYSSAGMLFGWDRAFYSLLTYFIAFKVIDMVEEGLEKAKAVMIITDPETHLADAIYWNLGRTCTKISGNGLISGDKEILYCVVTAMDMSLLREILQENSTSSFAVVSEVSEIIGTHIKENPFIRMQREMEKNAFKRKKKETSAETAPAEIPEAKAAEETAKPITPETK